MFPHFCRTQIWLARLPGHVRVLLAARADMHTSDSATGGKMWWPLVAKKSMKRQGKMGKNKRWNIVRKIGDGDDGDDDDDGGGGW